MAKVKLVGIIGVGVDRRDVLQKLRNLDGRVMRQRVVQIPLPRALQEIVELCRPTTGERGNMGHKWILRGHARNSNAPFGVSDKQTPGLAGKSQGSSGAQGCRNRLRPSLKSMFTSEFQGTVNRRALIWMLFQKLDAGFLDDENVGFCAEHLSLCSMSVQDLAISPDEIRVRSRSEYRHYER